MKGSETRVSSKAAPRVAIPLRGIQDRGLSDKRYLGWGAVQVGSWKGAGIGGALYSPTLATGGWNNLGGSIMATDSSASASDSINSDGQRFYRVVLLP